MTCVEKAKNKIKNMGFNDEQNLELSNLVELIIGELDGINSSMIYDNIKKNTMALIDKNIFTDKDIPKLIKINNDINMEGTCVNITSDSMNATNDSMDTTSDSMDTTSDSMDIASDSMDAIDDCLNTDNDSVNISIEI